LALVKCCSGVFITTRVEEGRIITLLRRAPEEVSGIVRLDC